MRKLLFLVMPLFMTVSALGHGDALSRETLKKFFPEAENFVSRQKALTSEQLLQVEKASGDEVQAVDRYLTVYVAIAKDFGFGKEFLQGLLAPSVSRAQMHIFNNAGHYSYREYPEDFARVVSDFIL